MARGSVRKRGNYWSIVYDIGVDEEGKRRQRRESGFETRREAEKALTVRQREVDTGTTLEITKATLAEYLRLWLKTTVAPTKRPLTTARWDRTIERYIAPVIGGVLLTKLAPAHIGRLHAELAEAGYSRTTIIAAHLMLHNALEQAVRRQYIGRNVCDAVSPGRREQYTATIWDRETAGRFVAAVRDDPDAVLWLLAIATGMRRGELLGLKWEDIDLAHRKLRIVRSRVYDPLSGGTIEQGTKGKRGRSVDLSPEQVEMLRAHRTRQLVLRARHANNWRDGDWVFAQAPDAHDPERNPGGRPLGPTSYGRRWDAILTKTGIRRIRPHDLRHTNATILLGEGVHPKIVQERLGHYSIAQTIDTYSQFIPTLGEDAARVLDRALSAPPEGDEARRKSPA